MSIFNILDKKIRQINHRRIDLFRNFKLALFKCILDREYFVEDFQAMPIILILRLDDKLGDAVSSTGFLKSIKDNYPECKIIVLCGSNTKNLFENLDFIDEVLEYKKGIFNTIRTFKVLKRQHFKYIINTSHILRPEVLFFISRLKAYKKIGFLNSNYKMFSDTISFDMSLDHVTQRYKKILNILKIQNPNLTYCVSVSNDDVDFVLGALTDRINDKKIIILNSFAGGRLRNLNFNSTKRILETVFSLDQDCIVLSVANQGDQSILKVWKSNLSGETWSERWVVEPKIHSLKHNIAAVSIADLVITPDTSWVHFSSALKKKLIAIYREDKSSDIEKNSIIWAPFETNYISIYSKFSEEQNINNFDINDFASAYKKLIS